MSKGHKTEIAFADNLPAKVGERIKQLRKKKGYNNQEHFAWDKGLSRSQYGKYEKGADMRVSSLAKIMQALEITPKEFFSEGFD